MEVSERISESQAALEEIDSSVLFEFEVREAADPVDVANFKFGTLAACQRWPMQIGFSQGRIECTS
jgi:hypothetical protein